ncbi:uncharacterized protein LOC122043637 [Zingiber officinale]|uniref:Uncharacterized protein n=1 Tax=Zingiber officinale TaxID=94328 RepID=A0A8J5I386_ZINOF|nr:uncharacterized protein LOC122043637 [Zingiber officinale]KAG6534395.1 hypothetical protein ZIOFF_008281 [Zingiber officinale]
MALPLGPRFLFLLLIQALVPPSSLQLHLDPGLIDRIVRDSAFRSYLVDHQKTAVVYNVSLPPSIPGVSAATVRFRTGSLRRHGAAVGEFRVAPGVVVRPRSRRLVVVAQNLGDLSSAYDGYRNISGFRLVSPVLGLLFYRAASVRNASVPPELEILATRGPITVDFSGLARCSRGSRVLCALFESDGNLSLSNATRGGTMCRARTQGHFALVVESAGSGGRSGGETEMEMKLSGWKVVVVSVAAGAFSSVLLGLVAVAVVTAQRKRMRTAEMERRAYEEEALQVSMVGHVRAPTAAVVRTAPCLENDVAPSW